MDDSLAGLARSVRGGLIAAKLEEAQFSLRDRQRSRVGEHASASSPRPTLRQRVRRELRRAARLLLRPFARRDGRNDHVCSERAAAGSIDHRRDAT